ncbi:MAG: DUF2760 domain-containing protein [Desulfosoma sp.]
MQPKAKLTLQTLIACVLFQGVVLAAFFWMGRDLLQSLLAHLQPFLGSQGGAAAPESAAALIRMEGLIRQAMRYLPAVIFGFGGVAILFLWIVVQAMGRRAVDLAVAASRAVAPVKVSAQKPAPKDTEVLPDDMDPKAVGAVQMLSVLQRQGRFIDFLEEDLNRYEDAQIGAAVRSIHESCKAALAECVELEAVMAQEEGSVVTVPSGFDPAAVRLTGNVSGDPPFRGVLRHRGWRIRKVQLPTFTAQVGTKRIVAPAEVEIVAEE